MLRRAAPGNGSRRAALRRPNSASWRRRPRWRSLRELTERLSPLAGDGKAVLEDAGASHDSIWAACRAIDGTTAADWMIENGRFPAEVVLHVARDMAAQLGDLHAAGVVHGDVGAAGLVLDAHGGVWLPMPALRGVVRPSEGYSFCDLPPEAYDYLPPERVGDGISPTVAGDWYSCGLLWWHLLTGRAPLAGGNSLARLKAAHAARIVNVRQLAPDVPAALEQAISACLVREPRTPRFGGTRHADLGATEPRAAAAIGADNRAASRTLGDDGTTCRAAPPHGSGRSPWALPSRPCCFAWPPGRSGGAVPMVPQRVQSKSVPWLRNRRRKLPRMILPSQRKSRRHARASQPTRSCDRAGNATIPDDPRELILTTDGSVRIASLDLKPGIRVHGRAGKRPLIRVPPEGLVVDCEDVVFDGIDFVWETKSPDAAPKSVAAMLVVTAQAVQFRGCSFAASQPRGPCAIAWRGGDNAATAGEVRLSDCVAKDVAASSIVRPMRR